MARYRLTVDLVAGTTTLVQFTPAEETAKDAEEALAQAAAASAAIRGANEETIRGRLLTGLATADTHITALEGTPTAAQQKAALLFAIKGLKQLARLELSALEATD